MIFPFLILGAKCVSARNQLSWNPTRRPIHSHHKLNHISHICICFAKYRNFIFYFFCLHLRWYTKPFAWATAHRVKIQKIDWIEPSVYEKTSYEYTATTTTWIAHRNYHTASEAQNRKRTFLFVDCDIYLKKKKRNANNKKRNTKWFDGIDAIQIATENWKIVKN